MQNKSKENQSKENQVYPQYHLGAPGFQGGNGALRQRLPFQSIHQNQVDLANIQAGPDALVGGLSYVDLSKGQKAVQIDEEQMCLAPKRKAYPLVDALLVAQAEPHGEKTKKLFGINSGGEADEIDDLLSLLDDVEECSLGIQELQSSDPGLPAPQNAQRNHERVAKRQLRHTDETRDETDNSIKQASSSDAFRNPESPHNGTVRKKLFDTAYQIEQGLLSGGRKAANGAEEDSSESQVVVDQVSRTETVSVSNVAVKSSHYNSGASSSQLFRVDRCFTNSTPLDDRQRRHLETMKAGEEKEAE